MGQCEAIEIGYATRLKEGHGGSWSGLRLHPPSSTVAAPTDSAPSPSDSSACSGTGWLSARLLQMVAPPDLGEWILNAPARWPRQSLR